MRSRYYFIAFAALIHLVLGGLLAVYVWRRFLKLWTQMIDGRPVRMPLCRLRAGLARVRDLLIRDTTSSQLEEARCKQFEFLCKLSTVFASMLTLIVGCNLLQGREPRLKEASCWTFLAWLILSAPLSLRPQWISGDVIDIWVAFVLLLEAANVSYLHVDLKNVEYQSFVLNVPRLFVALPVQREWVALLGSALHSAHVLIRLATEPHPVSFGYSGGDSSNVFTSEVLNFVMVSASTVVLRRIWESGETSRSELKVKSIELKAASSLLDGLFDAVVELDDHLKLTEPAPKLSALLLRNHTSQKDICGIDLCELFVDDEKERVKNYLFSSSNFPVYSRMVDCSSSPVDVELIHVRYMDFSNELRSLVGIRELAEATSFPKMSSRGAGSSDDILMPRSLQRTLRPSVYFDAVNFEVLGMNEAFRDEFDISKFKDKLHLDDIFNNFKSDAFLAKVHAASNHLLLECDSDDEAAPAQPILEGTMKTTDKSVRISVCLKKLEAVGVLVVKPKKEKRQQRLAKKAGSERSKFTSLLAASEEQEEVTSGSASETSSTRGAQRGTPSRAVPRELGRSVGDREILGL